MIWIHLLTIAVWALPVFFVWAMFATVLGGLGSALLMALIAWIGHRYGD